MKSFKCMIFCMVLSYTLMGAPVSKNEAVNVAVNFYGYQYQRVNKYFPTVKITETKEYYTQGKITMYMVSFDKKGFVIVAADNYVFPIIGYSLDEKLDINNLPESMVEWCNGISDQIIAVQTNKSSHYTENSLWSKFSKIDAKAGDTIKSQGPLLTTLWGQGNPYNTYCPAHPVTNLRCVTGCVATAMGQIMKYYNYPEHGTGSNYFYWTDSVIVNFGETSYRWSEMTNVPNQSSKDAIAELLYHCGVSVNMNYGVSESGAFSYMVPDALKNNFSYHPAVRYINRDQYQDTTWDVIIRENIDMLRPVLYSGLLFIHIY